MTPRHIYHITVERDVLLRERANMEIVSDAPDLTDAALIEIAARKLNIADFTYFDVLSQTPLTVADRISTVDQ